MDWTSPCWQSDGDVSLKGWPEESKYENITTCVLFHFCYSKVQMCFKVPNLLAPKLQRLEYRLSYASVRQVRLELSPIFAS